VRSSGSCATLTPVPGPTFVCKGLPAAERRSGASICAVIRAPVDSIHRESSGLAELGVFALERQVRSTRRHIVRSRIRRRCAPEGCPTAAGTEPNGTGCGACRSRVQLTAVEEARFIDQVVPSGNGRPRQPRVGAAANARFTGKRTWDAWIRPNGTVTSSGRDWLPAEQWAEQTLARPGRDGPMPGNAGWRRSVDAQVKGLTEHLARILDRHGVDLP
jgi:hypothetical protein